ncbi:L7Ae/L30e/S12e/Gadd45 family ribosomal protein [Porcipelethomonas sp.]|uniref:L7Ae/L30e/S12e/Gadd45 family ribosomal protein n=1 Tax=Porcipelethomonas sp. TaxID=2981675 RepID=UPI003EFA1616
MNSQQKIINLLTICRKSGKMISGFDAVKEAVYEGNVSCVLTTDDISQKTLKEVKFFCGNSKVDVLELGIDSADLYGILGKEVVVAAISDFGFAKRFKELANDPLMKKAKKKQQ